MLKKRFILAAVSAVVLAVVVFSPLQAESSDVLELTELQMNSVYGGFEPNGLKCVSYTGCDKGSTCYVNEQGQCTGLAAATCAKAGGRCLAGNCNDFCEQDSPNPSCSGTTRKIYTCKFQGGNCLPDTSTYLENDCIGLLFSC